MRGASAALRANRTSNAIGLMAALGCFVCQCFARSRTAAEDELIEVAVVHRCCSYAIDLVCTLDASVEAPAQTLKLQTWAVVPLASY